MRGSYCNHYRIDWAQYKDFVNNGTLITKWLKSGESDPVAKDTRFILYIGYFEGATLEQESYCYYYYYCVTEVEMCYRL